MKFNVKDKVRLKEHVDKNQKIREFVIVAINRDILGTPRYLGKENFWGKGYYAEDLELVEDTKEI